MIAHTVFIHSHVGSIEMRHTQELCGSLACQPSVRLAILHGGIVKAAVVSKLVQVAFGDDGSRLKTYQRKLQLKEVRSAIAANVSGDDERHYVCCLLRVGE